MSVSLRVLPTGIGDRLPLTLWVDEADRLGAAYASLNAHGQWSIEPYLRARGAIYDLPEPPPPSPREFLGELTRDQYNALWDGKLPAGIDPERLAEYHRAEIAHARTRDPLRPGTPAFKLIRNGPPWHITAAECQDLVRLAAGPPAPDAPPLDAEQESDAHEVLGSLLALLEQGADADGVIAL